MASSVTNRIVIGRRGSARHSALGWAQHVCVGVGESLREWAARMQPVRAAGALRAARLQGPVPVRCSLLPSVRHNPSDRIMANIHGGPPGARRGQRAHHALTIGPDRSQIERIAVEVVAPGELERVEGWRDAIARPHVRPAIDADLCLGHEDAPRRSAREVGSDGPVALLEAVVDVYTQSAPTRESVQPSARVKQQDLAFATQRDSKRTSIVEQPFCNRC